MHSKLLEEPDLQKKKSPSIEERFAQLVEWTEDEGLEVPLLSFIQTRFEKVCIEDLSDCEKEITYENLRLTVIMTRHNRKASYDQYN